MSGFNEVIPILRVRDAGAVVQWYQRLGFTEEAVHRFGPGMPAFVTVVSGSVHLFLSEHAGDAKPNTLIYLQVDEVGLYPRHGRARLELDSA